MSESDVQKPGTDSLDDLLRDAQAMRRDGDLEGALALFQAAARFDAERIEIEGHIDMVRSLLLKRYREEIGDVSAVPRLRIEQNEILRYNLPPDAGFVLSLVDGATSVDQLVTLSGMAAFEAYRILANLIEAEIVGMKA